MVFTKETSIPDALNGIYSEVHFIKNEFLLRKKC